MDDSANLVVGMLVGTVGLALLIYGKKQVRVPHMVIGLTMMVFPYFMPSALLTGAIATVLTLALVGATRMGW
jgi:hypothetical protein